MFRHKNVNLDNWYYLSLLLSVASKRPCTKKSLIDKVMETSPLVIDPRDVDSMIESARRHGWLTYSERQVICPDRNTYVSVLAISLKGRKKLQEHVAAAARIEDVMARVRNVLEETSPFVKSKAS